MRRLKVLREKARLSRTQLSHLARVYGSLVGQIKLGRLNPPPDSVVLKRFAAALDFGGAPGVLLDEVDELTAAACEDTTKARP